MNHKTALQQVGTKLKKAAPYITLACFILFVLYVAFDIYTASNAMMQMSFSDYVNYDKFKSEKKNIDILTKRFLEIYESEKDENDDIDYVFIKDDFGDGWEIAVDDWHPTKSVPKSDEEKEAANSVTSFKWSYMIRVYDDRVVFCGAGHFDIVYTKNGFPPAATPKEDYYIDRIAGKYYMYLRT